MEALQRTVISGAVTMQHANRMVQALVEAYPMPEGSDWTINWEHIRTSVGVEELGKVIKVGGLSKNKSGYLKGILDKVYNDNILRVDALGKDLKGTIVDGFPNLTKLSREKKGAIVDTIKKDSLSLNWLAEIEDYRDILDELTAFKGVSIKTASCVSYFAPSSLLLPIFNIFEEDID